MKQLFWILAAVLCISCNAYKKNTSNTSGNKIDYPPYKSAFYFDNCKDAIAFLKAIIINRQADNSLKIGYFRIPYINAAYANAEDIIPVSCLVGMPINELEAIFGLGSSDGDNTFWYFLKYNVNMMGIEVKHRNGVVEKFNISQSTIQVGPGK